MIQKLYWDSDELVFWRNTEVNILSLYSFDLCEDTEQKDRSPSENLGQVKTLFLWKQVKCSQVEQ